MQVDDAAAFTELTEALSTLGITPQAQRVLFKSFAACLHLGNVTFAFDTGAHVKELRCATEPSKRLSTIQQKFYLTPVDSARASNFTVVR